MAGDKSPVQGLRGTGDFSANQRPTNFGRVSGRVTKADIELLEPNIHRNHPHAQPFRNGNVTPSARVKARRKELSSPIVKRAGLPDRRSRRR